MLMKSDINPFESQETKPYKNDPRISAMTDLVDAFQRDDIHQYESILQNNKDVLADPFIAENIDEVSRNMRTKAVLKLIAPYTRFSLAFIAQHIKISLPEVQDILGFLIMDKKLKAKINQEKGTVHVESANDVDRVQAVRDWSSAIGSLCKTVLDDGEGFKYDENSSLMGIMSSTNGYQGDFGGGGAAPGMSGPAGRANGPGRSRGGMKGKGFSGRASASVFS